MTKKYDMHALIRAVSGEKQPTMGGLAVPYMPTSTDCWTNPLDEYKNTKQKSNAWREAIDNNEFAIDSEGKKHPIKEFGISDLAFVAGLWRVQNKLPYKITRVRKRDMVLLNKIDRTESTLFEFYRGKMVNYNCYGAFIGNDVSNDFIIAKYETDNATYWGYGETLEEARAYLGLKVYDEYKDVINVIACKNKLKNK